MFIMQIMPEVNHICRLQQLENTYMKMLDGL